MLRSLVGPLAPGMAIRTHRAVPALLGSRPARVPGRAPGSLAPGSSSRLLVPRRQQQQVTLAQRGGGGADSGSDARDDAGDYADAMGASGRDAWDAAGAAPARPEAAAAGAAARWLANAAKLAGCAALFVSAAALTPRAAHAAAAPAADSRERSNEHASTSGADGRGQQQQQRWWRRGGAGGARGGANPVGDFADAGSSKKGGGAAVAGVEEVYVGPGVGGSSKAYEKGGKALPAPKELERIIRTDPDLQRLIASKKAEHYRRTRQQPGSDKAYEAALRSKLGVPLDFDDLMTSFVYAPQDVPGRLSRGQLYAQVDALMNQYDNEDFDLGIKQFMIEQAIQQEMEEGLDKKGDNKDFEEKLAEQLFAGEDNTDKKNVRSEDVPTDAFTTEAAEEAWALYGEPASLQTAWRNTEHLTELAYTQFWTLVQEGHVAKVRVYGPEKRAAMVSLKASAPGGERVAKVVLVPDPDLIPHLVAHGVSIDPGQSEQDRVGRALLIQIARYTMPFVFISFCFWLLHTWILDPIPNKFRRREFIRYRREILHVGSKLNFRSPARQVFIDTAGPDFISWNDINGIDEVKREIEEIIDYLKNPALLRLRGVNRIGGVLLAGAPGTGKTLLAKAIAAESGVRMFTCSGTDFYDVYTGVGARRIRETFDMMRNFAPAILFVDEFDALGAARGAAAGGDESASIINELLVQMDGFEDNRGIVVLGATNRPGAIDSALIRPGRFDRIIYMPLPDTAGRAKILQVHARNKAVDPTINWIEVARSMGGFTGADCMGLMNRAARMAARQGRPAITEDDIYAAMENKAMEAHQEMTNSPLPGNEGVPDPIPHQLRKAICVYEAGKALLAYMTPEFDEIARISICPYNIVTGYTLFVEDEEARADSLLTRSDMEAAMVVALAGRCAEKLVMGESEMTGLGSPDLFHANMIAREMVLSAGMGSKVGPLDLMKLHAQQADGGNLLRTLEPKERGDEDYYYQATDMSTEQARIALAEVIELLEAAEAKAYYGLAVNWDALQALAEALMERSVLTGKEVATILERNGVIHFPDPYIQGFGWDQAGELQYPFRPTNRQQRDPADAPSGAAALQEDSAASAASKEAQRKQLEGLAKKTWFAGTDLDAPRGPDGKYADGWHWGVMPYSVRRDVPEWYLKEVERYSY